MNELKLTIPEGVNNVKAELEFNEKTGNSKITIQTNKSRIQYVGQFESQEKLDYVVDTLLYTINF
jgi:osmotically-inducible protein OsmY